MCYYTLNGKRLVIVVLLRAQYSALTCYSGKGSRIDLTQKRQRREPNQNGPKMYALNRSPPSWIRIFSFGDENSSCRTQAAAVAYMFPPNVTGISINLRFLTIARRHQNFFTVLHVITVPPNYSFIPLHLIFFFVGILQ